MWLLVRTQYHEGMQSSECSITKAYNRHRPTNSDILPSEERYPRFHGQTQCVLSVLLFCSAFVSVNHSQLLRVLGLGGTALVWFDSLLIARIQAVVIRDSTAPSVELQRGVSQGSVLGPILFTIYTNALGDIVRRHDVKGISVHMICTVMTPRTIRPIQFIEWRHASMTSWCGLLPIF